MSCDGVLKIGKLQKIPPRIEEAVQHSFVELLKKKSHFFGEDGTIAEDVYTTMYNIDT